MSKTDESMKGLQIVDQALIQQYKDELKIKGAYIPPQRDDSTMDMEALKAGTHAKSIDMIGQQSAISITVCDTDPEKDSQNSIFRLHLRIADGVHRWRETQAKGLNPVEVLDIKFFKVKDFPEYAKLKALLDTKKADNPAEKKFDVESLCESIFRSGTPREKVSTAVKKLYAGIIPESTLNECIPSKYKDETKVREKPKTEEKPEPTEPTKHQQDLQKMVNEITALTKENTKLTKDNEALKGEVKKLNDMIAFTKLEKTIDVQGLDGVKIAVSFNPEGKNFVARKA